MPTGVDLFVLFRWALATVCTIYATVVMLHSLWRWLGWFASSRETAMVGRYTAVLLLRLKFKRFGGELIQIMILLILFGLIVYLHHDLEIPGSSS